MTNAHTYTEAYKCKDESIYERLMGVKNYLSYTKPPNLTYNTPPQKFQQYKYRSLNTNNLKKFQNKSSTCDSTKNFVIILSLFADNSYFSVDGGSGERGIEAWLVGWFVGYVGHIYICFITDYLLLPNISSAGICLHPLGSCWLVGFLKRKLADIQILMSN